MAAIEKCSVIILLGVIAFVTGQLLRPETSKRNDEVCKKVAEDPYFETEMVVGKSWRIYYGWNMKIGSKCLDMTFKNATQQVVQRFWNDMHEYLELQPTWDAATLHVTMGRPQHELLMLADQGPAGSFQCVPNVAFDGNILPPRNSVPLLKFQLKLLQQGRFLLMTDCYIGVSTLSARLGRPPYQSEILSATAALGLGDGFPACVTDKNSDEHFLLIERFVVMVDSDLKSNVNWSASELFVETSIDLSGLFIRQEMSGLFRFIPALYTEYHSIPTLLFGMKVVDGYLGMMNCERKIAYALAPVENMPKPEQIEAIAAKLNFWSPFGHSYLLTGNLTASFVQNEDIDDDDDDEEREIEREKDAFEMF